jgi:hypothetical protein
VSNNRIGLGGGESGGPVIVIQPDPDPGGGGVPMATPTYTGWHVGCVPPNENLPQPENMRSGSGIPGRYSSGYGAKKMVVTLISGAGRNDKFKLHAKEAFIAESVEIELDGSRVLTIDFPDGHEMPSWKRDGAIYRYNGQMSSHDWPQDLYGKITKLTISDASNPGVDVRVEDLKEIRIFYNKRKGSKKCS